ncbi:hypothetical protein ACQPW3_05880 [Actinosynnema sp. CA-248983]
MSRPSIDWAHYTLIEATGVGPEIVRPLGGQYVPTVGKALWGVGADGGPTGDRTNWRESAPSAAGVWQCVEWRMDATDNRVTVWIDGQAKPDLTVSTKDHGGNPSTSSSPGSTRSSSAGSSTNPTAAPTTCGWTTSHLASTASAADFIDPRMTGYWLAEEGSPRFR